MKGSFTPHMLAGSGKVPPDIADLKWRVYLRVFISALSGILFALAWIRWEPSGTLPGVLDTGPWDEGKAVSAAPIRQNGQEARLGMRQAGGTLRDPFRPMTLDSGRKRTHRRRRLLKGLFREGERQFALIGNRMVTQGDWIFGMRVITIRNNKVVLANNRNIRVLFLF